MIIEQIRYYVTDETREQVLEMRREVSQLRAQLGLPEGKLLVADPLPDEGPGLVWQCGYPDEGDMGMAEATLIGNTDYEAARSRLAELVVRVEVELYTAEEE